VYVPDSDTYATRPRRIATTFQPYYSRPVVVYNDNYNSLFWWWLLDQSTEERARWAYHHRNDMDLARYDALLANDTQLAGRLEQLESEAVPVDASYSPAGIERDLTYTDRYVDRSYANRPTRGGAVSFWMLIIPTGLAVIAFLCWFVFVKRWSTTA
jgi:hypothetical protein